MTKNKNLFLALALMVTTSCALAGSKTEDRTPAQTGSVGSVMMASTVKRCAAMLKELRDKGVLCNLEKTQLDEFTSTMKVPLSPSDENKLQNLQGADQSCRISASEVCMGYK